MRCTLFWSIRRGSVFSGVVADGGDAGGLAVEGLESILGSNPYGAQGQRTMPRSRAGIVAVQERLPLRRSLFWRPPAAIRYAHASDRWNAIGAWRRSAPASLGSGDHPPSIGSRDAARQGQRDHLSADGPRRVGSLAPRRFARVYPSRTTPRPADHQGAKQRDGRRHLREASSSTFNGRRRSQDSRGRRAPSGPGPVLP
jgi:hypothetical protein